MSAAARRGASAGEPAAIVRVALVDDQALVLRGLSSLLGDFSDIAVVLEALDAEDALRALDRLGIDVVVSDIRMPGVDGFELIRRLRESGNAVPVVLLTTFDDEDVLRRAVDAGAQGLLLKDALPEDLHDAILRAARGDALLQPISLGPLRAALPREDSAPGLRLTDREASILRLIAGGYSNKEIGRSLHLAEGTVKNYVSELLLKLDCRDRTHAVLKALTQRLL